MMKIKIYKNIKGERIGAGLLFILVSLYLSYVIFFSWDKPEVIWEIITLGVFIFGLYLLITYKKIIVEIIEVEKYEIINAPGKVNIEDTNG